MFYNWLAAGLSIYSVGVLFAMQLIDIIDEKITGDREGFLAALLLSLLWPISIIPLFRKAWVLRRFRKTLNKPSRIKRLINRMKETVRINPTNQHNRNE